MSEYEDFADRDFDSDTARDVSRECWPERLAREPVRRGRPPCAKPEVPTTTRLSQEVIDHFRACGW